MYPELVRNTWLELTPVKRWSLPVFIGLLVLLVLAQHPLGAVFGAARHDLAYLGMGLFAIFSLWGVTKASASVSNEISGGTWDQQRLSRHRPFDLLLGKLLGSTIFEWYGCAFALAIYSVARLPDVGPIILGLNLFTLVSGSLLLQSSGVLMSLAGANAVRSTRRPGKGNVNQGLGLVMALGMGSVLGPLVAELMTGEGGALTPVAWWWSMPMEIFIPLSTTMFIGWTLAGGHRLIRAELQEPVSPAPWLGFLGFLTLYIFPLILNSGAVTELGNPLAILACTAAAVTGPFVPLLLLGERKDVVRLRGLAAARVRGDWRALWNQAPLWIYTLGVFTASVAALGVMAVVTPSAALGAAFAIAAVCLTMIVRDAGLILAVYTSRRLQREPGLVVLFGLALMYVKLPLLLTAMGTGFAPLLWLLVPLMALFPAGGAITAANILALAWAVPATALSWAIAVPGIRRALGPAE